MKKKESEISGGGFIKILIFVSDCIADPAISLTPDSAVHCLSEQIEECYYAHVEEEETCNTSSAKESKKRVHPNPNWQVHPYHPEKQVWGQSCNFSLITDQLYIVYQLFDMLMITHQLK